MAVAQRYVSSSCLILVSCFLWSDDLCAVLCCALLCYGTGYTLAAAILIGTSQVKNVLGIKYSNPNSDFYIDLYQVFKNLPNVKWQALVFAGMTIIILSLLQWWKKAKIWGSNVAALIPGALLVVVLGTSISYAANQSGPISGLSLIGKVPAGLPGFAVPRLDSQNALQLVSSGTLIGILGFMEALTVAKQMALKRGYKIDVNQELLGMLLWLVVVRCCCCVVLIFYGVGCSLL